MPDSGAVEITDSGTGPRTDCAETHDVVEDIASGEGKPGGLFQVLAQALVVDPETHLAFGCEVARHHAAYSPQGETHPGMLNCLIAVERETPREEVCYRGV